MRYNTHKPQKARDLSGERTIIFIGKCIQCERNCYGYDNEPNPDPRGLIDPRHCAHDFVASEYDMTGPDVVCCFDCHNTRELYFRGLALAKEQWKELS